VKYTPFDGVSLSDPTMYYTIVGNLVYLTITLPNIAYVVHVVSQFVVSPTIIHSTTILCTLRYVRGTQFQSLFFPSSSSLELCVYFDANCAHDLTEQETRYCFSFLQWSWISYHGSNHRWGGLVALASFWHLCSLFRPTLSIVTTRVLFKLLITQSFMSLQSILKLIVISLIIIFNMEPLHCFSFFSTMQIVDLFIKPHSIKHFQFFTLNVLC